MKTNSFKAVVIAGLMSSLLAVTACGAQTTPAPAESTTPVTQSASPSVEATPAPQVSTAEKPLAADGKTPLTGTHGLKVKGPAQNENGQYLQITISDDDPALVYNADIVAPQIAQKFTPEEITEAQKFAMTFLVEEGWDSTINDGKNYDEWLGRNAHNFTSIVQPELVTALNADNESIHLRNWSRGQGYTYAYDKDSTRYLNYDIDLMGVFPSVYPVNSESMVFTYNYELVTAQKNLAGKAFAVQTKGEGKFGVEKDPNTPGKWLISEIFSKYDTFAGAENLNP
jgi:hypothetical protein